MDKINKCMLPIEPQRFAYTMQQLLMQCIFVSFWKTSLTLPPQALFPLFSHAQILETLPPSRYGQGKEVTVKRSLMKCCLLLILLIEYSIQANQAIQEVVARSSYLCVYV